MATRSNHDRSIEESLTAIRGAAPRRSPTVRVLSAYAGHADCNLATLGFAAEVDFEAVLRGTVFEAPFGQSPFAIRRGITFEQFIAKDGYAQTLELLRTQMGFWVRPLKQIVGPLF